MPAAWIVEPVDVFEKGDFRLPPCLPVPPEDIARPRPEQQETAEGQV